ncbi:cellulosome anchor protein [Paenibacillus sp. PK3_47]|uniref:S-layer homology domain-containing protein n=1 Tax=Paenibacillus sp. PK3_47 TaxID=2072642 RepID=UPI00201D84E6|nr:S-layer homology domain-containing protein [Paenibacillus sp. PK3_47]UQZ36154.1 cellulosome anchor protein [Paenibacillus sp. PK3_47]
MSKNVYRTFLAWIVFSMALLNIDSFRVSADSILTVSQQVDHSKVSVTVHSAANMQDTVTILIMQKLTHSVAYMDQAVLRDGQHTFSTLLPKGEYYGFVGSVSSGKADLNEFSIMHEETITGFRPLKAITVAKGGSFVLPGSVIAVFDNGANREVGVKWTKVPDTETSGQFLITGEVNGSPKTVELVLNVGEAPATPEPTATPAPTTSPTPTITPSPSSPANTAPPASGQTAGAAAKPSPSPGADSPAVTLNAVLDGTTGIAKAEVTEAAINAALSKAVSDIHGLKTIEIIMLQAEGAKGYEPVLPSSVFKQGDKKLLFKLTTPIGTVELPGHMFEEQLPEGSTTVSIVLASSDKSVITDPSVRNSVGDKPVIELTVKADGKAVEWQNKNAPVKVSLPYMPAPADLKNSEHLVVWYIDEAGRAAKVSNTKYSPAESRVTFSTSHFSKFAVSYVFKTFNDAAVFRWAQKPIEVLASKGIINGVSDTAFAPQANITRADFLVILVRTLGLTADFSGNFSDVSPSAYYYEALGIARQLGIATGTGNGGFNPAEPVSRQDLMVLSRRALQINGTAVTEGNAADLRKYSDWAELSAYAAEDVAAMVKEGLVSGSGTALSPKAYANRAEAAVIMYRIFNKL